MNETDGERALGILNSMMAEDERKGLPSASSWPRYELCAGSWQLETEARKLGQLAHESSPAAERGELIHAWLAGAVDEDGNEIKLDEEEQKTADCLQLRATEQCERIFDKEKPKVLNEKRLWLVVGGKTLASGRFDRVFCTPSVALVQDFKTGGREPTRAEQNSQMKMLAVLVGLDMPKETLREVIVQIISKPFGVTEDRYDLQKLAKAYNEILATLRAIQNPRAALNPSPEACRYCPAINICQAVKDFILPVAKTQISELPDGARGAKLLDEVAVLEKHLKEIKKYYERRCNADPTYRLPGYKVVDDDEIEEVSDWCYELVPGNEVREVTDWEKAKLRLGEYLDKEQMAEAQSYTLSKLETVLSKALQLTSDRAKEKLNEILNGLIVKNQNKSSLKRVNGKAKVMSLA